MNPLPILLIPEKTDPEFEQVFEAFTRQGGQIKRLGKYWLKDEELAKQPLAVYGNQTFALVLAQIYNMQLTSPDDAFIAELGTQWTKRKILLTTIGQLTDVHFPAFVKPVIPKLFLAGVFQAHAHFQTAIHNLQPTEEALVSSIVSIQAEVRSYVMNGEIKDLALYEGRAGLLTARQFLADFLAIHKTRLPNVLVIDLAYGPQTGWFILEFNACWGAGLNGCQASLVLDCILAATQKNG